jgi:hypothetical protein
LFFSQRERAAVLSDAREQTPDAIAEANPEIDSRRHSERETYPTSHPFAPPKETFFAER